MTSLVSDETLGKVVRLVWERPILLADRTSIMTHVLEDQWANALETAREMLSPEDDAIAALDEANEEAAVTYDDREAKLDAVCRTKLYRGEWVTPGAVPGLARAMAESLGKVTLAAKHPASYEDPRPEVEAKRVALKRAIREAMSDPRLTRVQAAMTALRPARCVTMARIDEFLARNKVAEAINEADGMRQREPFVHLVNELVDALRALDESQSAKSCPLISDATLAKIVRAMYSADTDAAAEADVFDSIDRDVILEAVVNDKHAEALENARGCLAHRTDGASVIAALEEANEEAARTNDEREPRVEGECQELNLVRGEWVTPGAVPGLARAMADTIRATVAAHETQLDAVTADVRMAWTIAGHTYSTAAGHDAFTELRRKVEAGEWDEPLPDTTRIDATAKHPIPHLDDAPEPPKRQEHDPSRRWACPKCTSVLAVERIFEIVAGRGERYAHVVRCLCGEVRP